LGLSSTTALAPGRVAIIVGGIAEAGISIASGGAAPDVGWVCLAGWALLFIRRPFAKPPDCEDARTPRRLPYADGRAGFRHTHPTTAYLRASARALSITSLRVTSAPPRRLLSSAASMKA